MIFEQTTYLRQDNGKASLTTVPSHNTRAATGTIREDRSARLADIEMPNPSIFKKQTAQRFPA